MLFRLFLIVCVVFCLFSCKDDTDEVDQGGDEIPQLIIPKNDRLIGIDLLT
ncbi:MAG: hypothetical protein JKY48_11880 [Flavobacteriales bacterium]|nr:hypothetical protein [Flavobacteriales bacterium]